MRIRHRIPTIFNLSMVDVLCCALGCVILLWLLNLREAKEESVTAGKTREQLKTTQALLDAAASQRERLQRAWELDRDRRAALQQELGRLRNEHSAAEERLARLTRAQQTLLQEQAAVSKQLSAVEDRLRAKESLAKAAANRIDKLEEQLRDAERRAQQLQALAEQVPRLRADVQHYRSQLADAAAQAQAFEKTAKTRAKELADASRRLAELQGEKQRLSKQASRALAAVENRFEGIALTGRRVVFLVDMSGSMELVDERTPDAQKWLGVRQTLSKIMRSLPDLEKFQVLLFANQVSYLLGNDGLWLDYDREASADRVAQALAAIRPLGSTNMYAAFETAFRFRAAGLDTIYVFSDGLPNSGPGLSPEQMTLKETERSEILARYIRTLLRRDWNRPLAGQPRVRINTIGFFYCYASVESGKSLRSG